MFVARPDGFEPATFSLEGYLERQSFQHQLILFGAGKRLKTRVC